MSAINQIFGENTSSSLFQYQTPKKNQTYLKTNASLVYSSIASNQFRSSELKYPQLHDNTQSNVLNQDLLTNRDIFADNNSAITLNPIDSQEQLQQLLKVIKLVHFIGKQKKESRMYLQKKRKIVHKLKQQVQLLHSDIQKRKAKYDSAKSAYIERQRLSQQRAKRRNSIIEKQMEDMRLQVMRIRCSLSRKHRSSIPTQRQNTSDNKQKRRFSQKHSRSEPKSKNSPRAARADYQQQPYQNQQQPYQNHYNPKVRSYHQPAPFHYTHSAAPFHYSQPYSQTGSQTRAHNPEQEWSAHSRRYPPPSLPPNQEQTFNPFDVLGHKLRTERSFNALQKSQQPDDMLNTKDIQQFERSQQIQSGQRKQASQRQSRANQMDVGSMHIKLRQAEKSSIHQQEMEAYLNYLDQDQLGQSGTSKVLKEQVQSKQQEKKDNSENQDIEDMVFLLENSIRRSEKKDKKELPQLNKQQKQLGLPQQPKSGMGFNLVTSTNGEDYDFVLPEKSRELSSSKIDISIQSDERRHGKSESASPKEGSRKNSSVLGQSYVNINMEETLQSPKNKGQTAAQSRRNDHPLPEKILSNIEEVEEDMLSRQNTPIDLTNNYEFKTITESARSRKTKQDDRNLKTSGLSESNQHSIKTPLSRPPSLIQQEDDSRDESKGLSGISLSPESRRLGNDGLSSFTQTLPKNSEVQQSEIQLKGMSSIQLSSQSRRATPNLSPDKADDFSQSKLKQKNDQDDIFGIHLVAQSRISRQSKYKRQSSEAAERSSLHYSEEFLPIESRFKDDSLPNESRFKEDMSRSQALDNRFSLEQRKTEGLGEEIEEIRTSSASSIVRKGSAIQKVKNRGQVNTLKVSNYGKAMIKNSSYLSNPIVQEKDQEEETHVPTHKKNFSSFK